MEFGLEKGGDSKLKSKLKIKKTVNEIKKIRTKTTNKEFIEKGKIKLFVDTVKIETPLFVHFEFDEFRPWYIPINNETKNFTADFMLPPGKWKMFFTTQLNYFILSEI